MALNAQGCSKSASGECGCLESVVLKGAHEYADFTTAGTSEAVEFSCRCPFGYFGQVATNTAGHSRFEAIAALGNCGCGQLW